ncbi:MAG TPA: hypothetical protein VFA21_04255 [Pyrinomonadaceae bacterium]|jgi:hypothetical protein|nr:hypothetical protein [Pyrinomonadaceae bacterium]
MLKGINLTLLMGPAVASPVPQWALDALVSVRVTTTAGKRSGFELSFDVKNDSPLQTLFLLTGGSVPPVLRTIIVVTINGTPDVIMDGVVTNHQITQGSQPGHSTLTLTGEDLSAVMDWLDLSGIPYPCLPPEGRVGLMLLKYMFLGVIPKVIPSVLIDVPIPIERIPTQRGTDLAYINYLADLVGYVFYIDPGPSPGMSFAYWGPDIKFGEVQPALNLDMDALSNVESLSFRFDKDKAVLPVVVIQNQETHVPIPIPIPPITPLNPPLGAIMPIPNKLEWISETAKYNPVQGALIGMAKASQMADAVSGTGSLDVLRYGRVLKARKLVGVRGVGMAYDGLYYVKSVTHNIKRGEYKQTFELTRNGLVSTLQQIPV